MFFVDKEDWESYVNRWAADLAAWANAASLEKEQNIKAFYLRRFLDVLNEFKEELKEVDIITLNVGAELTNVDIHMFDNEDLTSESGENEI